MENSSCKGMFEGNTLYLHINLLQKRSSLYIYIRACIDPLFTPLFLSCDYWICPSMTIEQRDSPNLIRNLAIIHAKGKEWKLKGEEEEEEEGRGGFAWRICI